MQTESFLSYQQTKPNHYQTVCLVWAQLSTNDAAIAKYGDHKSTREH